MKTRLKMLLLLLSLLLIGSAHAELKSECASELYDVAEAYAELNANRGEFTATELQGYELVYELTVESVLRECREKRKLELMVSHGFLPEEIDRIVDQFARSLEDSFNSYVDETSHGTERVE